MIEGVVAQYGNLSHECLFFGMTKYQMLYFYCKLGLFPINFAIKLTKLQVQFLPTKQY